MFEQFSQRNHPAAVDEPSTFEDDDFFVPRRIETTTDLDPQRLDGRSAQAGPRPRPPQLSERQAEALATFLQQRGAHPAEAAPAPVGETDPGSLPVRTRAATQVTPDMSPDRWRRLSDLNRKFPLRRLLPPEVMDKAELEVESRPARAYPIRRPGAAPERTIRPEYHGIRACGDLRTRGLGLMFPPHTVHARSSTSASGGDPCELVPVDHVHIRQAVVAPDDPLRSGRVRQIITRGGSGAVSALRRALGDRRPVPATCSASLHRAETVRLGDDTLTRLYPRYVVERTVVPAGALLSASEKLARCYVDLVAGRQDDPAALAAFLSDLLAAVTNAAEDNLLGSADGLPPATLLGLFGIAPAGHPTSIMIEDNAGPHPELDLDTGTLG